MTLPGDITELLLEQVRDALRLKTPLVIEGGGSKQFYGYPPRADLLWLQIKEHQGVIDYHPEELVLHVRAGTNLVEIQRLLADNGQILAFEPPDFDGTATIGGAIASGLSGPRRPYAGAARDYVLGVTLLTGSAHVLTFGGQVMKNVAGYDVSRLVTGAMGTLGIILDVSLKVLPAPELEVTRAITVKRNEFQTMLQSLSRVIPVSAAAHDNGAAHDNAAANDNGVLNIRVSGSEIAVNEALRKLAGSETDSIYWNQLNNLQNFSQDSELWRVSVAPGSSLFLAEADLVDWGGGLRWLVDPPFNPREIMSADDSARGGHATLVRAGSSAEDVFQPLDEPLAGIHRRLKQQFDPAGLFNPGRMYRDL